MFNDYSCEGKHRREGRPDERQRVDFRGLILQTLSCILDGLCSCLDFSLSLIPDNYVLQIDQLLRVL